MFLELFFEVNNFFWFDSIEVTSDTSVNDTDLLSDRHWLVLILLQKFGKTLTTRKKLLSGGIHIGTELSEGSDFTILGQIQFHGTGNLLHGLHLGGRSDTGDGKTDVNGGTDTLEEKFVFQEDLSVSDRNDVGGNVSGHISGLGLNDGEGGEGASSALVGHLGCTFEKTGVEVEDVTGVGLTSWGTTEKEGHLSVGNSL